MQTEGFNARALFVKETTPGTTPTNPALLRLSDLVTDFKLSLDVGVEGFRSVEGYDVVDFLRKTKKPGFQVTFALQRGDPLIDMLTRASDKTCPSYTFEFALNLSTASPAFFTFTGAKCDVELKSKTDDYVMATLTGKAMTLGYAGAAPSIGTGTREATLGTAFATFKGASLTKNAATWGFITEGFGVKVENGLNHISQLGSDVPAFIEEGARKISGSGDIYLKNGASDVFADVDGATSSTLVYKAGAVASGLPQLTLSGVVLGKFEVGANNKDGSVKQSVPYEAKTVAAVAL